MPGANLQSDYPADAAGNQEEGSEVPTPSYETLPAFMTVTEAARQLGISRAYIYNLHKSGAVRFSKLFGKTVVSQAEINRIIVAAESSS